MRPNRKWLLSVILSITYSIISGTVFIVLLFFSCCIPLITAALFYSIFRHFFGESATIPAIISLTIFASVFCFFLTLYNVVRSIQYALSTPLLDDELEHEELHDLIDSVADDIGINRFQSVLISPESNDFSTRYIGRRRYLELSIVPLVYLTRNEIRAIIAHECAHHRNNAMLLNRTHERATILFESFTTAIANTLVSFDRMLYPSYVELYEQNGFQKKKFLRMIAMSPFTHGIWTILPLVILIATYKWFLSRAEELIRDPQYEYYCDSIAAEYIGGNVLASALQKIVSLRIANERILKKIENNIEASCIHNENLNQLYLEFLNVEFHQVHYCNCGSARRKAIVEHKAKTHPSITSRCEKALSIRLEEDTSQPLLTQSDLISQLEKASKCSVVEQLEKTVAYSHQLDLVREAQKTEGEAIVVFSRSKVLLSSLSESFRIIINSERVGVIKANSRKTYYVSPGLCTIQIKVGLSRSNKLELVLLGNSQVEIKCSRRDATALQLELVRSS